ncbi:hypothetical protein TRFO_36853 [Tritrichomonas foetus]|uniref:Uncharacterized protein n=1 Tax=Tritrichomonas foetus TaxID=1144522 RepID=A0A1J4JCR0_9EUKA|nr:hypothetical protein TRFO_36853 [Tritrichomonas foetus]|eukprot:OHS96994.1 hypothetical protein TRFO_36853 [Tritrichomonas foetus]
MWVVTSRLRTPYNLYFYSDDTLKAETHNFWNILIENSKSLDGNVKGSVAYGFIVFFKKNLDKLFPDSVSKIFDFVNDIFVKNSDFDFDHLYYFNVLRLIKYILKYKYEFIQNQVNYLGNWFENILKFFHTHHIQLHVKTIATSLEFYKKLNSHECSKHFLQLMIADISHKFPYISSKSIYTFSIIISLKLDPFRTLTPHQQDEKKKAQNQDYKNVKLIVDKIVHLLTTHQNMPMLLKRSIYTFFSNLAKYSPNYFPYDFFFDYEKYINDEIERPLYFFALYDVYTRCNSCDLFSSIEKKEIKQKIAQIFINGLNKCDFVNWPLSIKFLDNIANDSISVLENSIKIIERYIKSMIVTEFSNQPYYYSTIYSSIGLILTLCCEKKVKILKWMPLILKHFPIRKEFEYVNCIFLRISRLYLLYTIYMNPFAQDLIRIYSHMLAAEQIVFSQFQFKAETLNQMVFVLNRMAKLNPQTYYIVSSGFLDEHSKDILEERIKKYS